MLNSLANRLLTNDYDRSSALFCKALVLFAFVKMLLLWPMVHTVMAYQPPAHITSWVSKIVFAPSILAATNVNLFHLAALGFLAAAFFLPWRYAVSIPFFWLCLNLYRVYFPMINGSDLVLFILAFWAILMPMGNPNPRDNAPPVLANMAVLLCQVQVALIYFLSGWDKLTSAVWRSGEAASYITHLQFVINPHWYGAAPGEPWQQLVSWIVIVFELGFGVAVWFRKTRYGALIIGAVFHALIAVTLSLPDFSLIMMLSYLIFLKDEDWRAWWFAIGKWRSRYL